MQKRGTRLAFVSIPEMAKTMFGIAPPDFLIPNRFDNRKRISNVPSPKLFFATRSDEIVPYAQARALYEIATEPRTGIEFSDCGHNDLHKKHGREWTDAIRAFTGGAN